MKNLRIIHIFLFTLIVLQGKSQDIFFSNPFNDRLYLNPAFAGTLKCGEFNIHSHLSNPLFTGIYRQTAASYETPIPRFLSGMGIRISSDNQGQGAVKTDELTLYYSRKIDISHKIKLSFGVSTGIIQRKIDYEKLIFSTQINPFSPTINQYTGQYSEINQFFFPDISAGTLIYTHNTFFGISAFHLQSLRSYQQSEPPVRMMVIAGKKIFIDKFDTENYLLNLAPFIAAVKQGTENIFMAGIFARKKIIKLGFIYRQNLFLESTSGIFVFEIDYTRYRISYSYETGRSKTGFLPNAGNELSIGVKLNCPKKITPRHAIYCDI